MTKGQLLAQKHIEAIRKSNLLAKEYRARINQIVAKSVAK
jgi:hypothetical protein